MANYRQKKKKKKRALPVIGMLLLIGLALLGAIYLAKTNGSVAEDRVSEYNYLSDGSSVYRAVGNGLAIASGDGLRVYNGAGIQTAEETLAFSNPVLTACGNYGAAYDTRGKTVKIFSEDGMQLTVKTDGDVQFVSLNKNGRSVVCSSEGGYKGLLTVYSLKGTILFQWYSGTGYLMSARLSDNGKNLTVLTVTAEGSRVVWFRTDSDQLQHELTIPGELLLDIGSDANGRFYGISSERVYLLDPENGASSILEYENKNLLGYSLDGGPLLALAAYRTGGACSLYKIVSGGKHVELLAETENTISSLDANSSYAAVLTDSEIQIFSRKDGTLLAEYPASACRKVSLCPDGTVIAAGPHYAEVHSVKG